jgi:hypothetical protein
VTVGLPAAAAAVVACSVMKNACLLSPALLAATLRQCALRCVLGSIASAAVRA